MSLSIQAFSLVIGVCSLIISVICCVKGYAYYQYNKNVKSTENRKELDFIERIFATFGLIVAVFWICLGLFFKVKPVTLKESVITEEPVYIDKVEINCDKKIYISYINADFHHGSMSYNCNSFDEISVARDLVGEQVILKKVIHNSSLGKEGGDNSLIFNGVVIHTESYGIHESKGWGMP